MGIIIYMLLGRKNYRKGDFMQKILIVEDDYILADTIGDRLENLGYEVYILKEYSRWKEEWNSINPDLILLDINLGEINGLELCVGFRKLTKIPILFITGRDSDENEIQALNLGGDDYIRKPFSIDVLVARIQRHLKTRSLKYRKYISHKSLILEIDKRILKNTETLEEVELPTIEFQMLFYLIARQEEIVSRGELMDYLWESRYYVDQNALNVNLSRLRNRLEEVSMKDCIQSIRGEGLRLC